MQANPTLRPSQESATDDRPGIQAPEFLNYLNFLNFLNLPNFLNKVKHFLNTLPTISVMVFVYYKFFNNSNLESSKATYKCVFRGGLNALWPE